MNKPLKLKADFGRHFLGAGFHFLVLRYEKVVDYHQGKQNYKPKQSMVNQKCRQEYCG